MRGNVHQGFIIVSPDAWLGQFFELARRASRSCFVIWLYDQIGAAVFLLRNKVTCFRRSSAKNLWAALALVGKGARSVSRARSRQSGGFVRVACSRFPARSTCEMVKSIWLRLVFLNTYFVMRSTVTRAYYSTL